nr:MAG TPA: hypothetical protein [Caudoviricetes sp.]
MNKYNPSKSVRRPAKSLSLFCIGRKCTPSLQVTVRS